MTLKKVYRVQHTQLKVKGSHYFLGPFQFLLHHRGNNKPPLIKKLDDIMTVRDFTYFRRYSKVMSLETYRQMKKIPASFTMERPGMWEDPLLRHNLRMIDFNKFINGFMPFCFESMDDLTRWFSHTYENIMLRQNGFVVATYKVEPKNIWSGYHQSVFLDSPNNILSSTKEIPIL